MNKTTMILVCILVIAAGCGKSENALEKKSVGPAQVHLTKDLQESIGLTFMKTEKKKFITSVEVYGMIAQDTENTAHVMVKEPGIIKSFTVKVGDSVEKDKPIGKVAISDGAEQEIVSPLDGIIITQYAKEGEKVDSLSSIATVANPDLLKANFDIYEKDLAFVRQDEEVVVKSSAYPNKEFHGKVVFVSPRVDEDSRTVKIRVDIENKERLLKFGMSVTGKILQKSEEEYVIVPLESLQSINDSWAVFVQVGDESLEVRQIQRGAESEAQVQILNGLKADEMVAVRGSFTLKSELLKEQLGDE